MTFYRWLLQQHQREDAVGDLARDMRRDAWWPRYVRTFPPLQRYLASRDACEGAHKALADAYREWQQYAAEAGEGAADAALRGWIEGVVHG